MKVKYICERDGSSGDALETLTSTVNRHIEEGWIPVHSVVVIAQEEYGRIVYSAIQRVDRVEVTD